MKSHCTRRRQKSVISRLRGPHGNRATNYFQAVERRTYLLTGYLVFHQNHLGKFVRSRSRSLFCAMKLPFCSSNGRRFGKGRGRNHSVWYTQRVLQQRTNQKEHHLLWMDDFVPAILPLSRPVQKNSCQVLAIVTAVSS